MHVRLPTHVYTKRWRLCILPNCMTDGRKWDTQRWTMSHHELDETHGTSTKINFIHWRMIFVHVLKLWIFLVFIFHNKCQFGYTHRSSLVATLWFSPSHLFSRHLVLSRMTCVSSIHVLASTHKWTMHIRTLHQYSSQSYEALTGLFDAKPTTGRPHTDSEEDDSMTICIMCLFWRFIPRIWGWWAVGCVWGRACWEPWRAFDRIFYSLFVVFRCFKHANSRLFPLLCTVTC